MGRANLKTGFFGRGDERERGASEPRSKKQPKNRKNRKNPPNYGPNILDLFGFYSLTIRSFSEIWFILFKIHKKPGDQII